MRFVLIDKITDLRLGDSITAVKNLSLAEEYLGDHFPGFPVMPGVLMLEAMTQAGSWLVRASEDFAHSMVVLKEAKNVKYGSFVEPGQTLTVTCELMSQEDRLATLKCDGMVEGQRSVSARLVLERYNLAEADPEQAAVDEVIVARLRQDFSQLCPKPMAVRTAKVEPIQ